MRLKALSLALIVITILVIAGFAVSIYSTEQGKQGLSVIVQVEGAPFKGGSECAIKYNIQGGMPNYTVELFYQLGDEPRIFIGFDNQTSEGWHSYLWITPLVTNTKALVWVRVTDNKSDRVEAHPEARFEIDSTPPSEVTDLIACNATKNSIELQWTAPGEDGNTGTATSYDIRYNIVEITDANWDSSPQVTGEPTPSVAGTPENFIVTSLSSGTKYYFALKSIDNVGLESNISNIATNHTNLEVTLVWPVGNEELKGNTNYTIRYKIAGTEAPFIVKLYYAYNNTDFIFIVEDNISEADEHNYTWTTPNIISISVRIKINVTDSTSISDESVSGEFEIDSIAPGKVNDLTVSAVTYNSVTLTWSAPGEDGEIGHINISQDEEPDLVIPDPLQDPDYAEKSNVTSNITVEDNVIIYKCRVYLRINHSYIGDLRVKLSHPDGTTVTLFNKTGADSKNLWGWYENNNFTWEGSGDIEPNATGNLSAFNYKGSRGIWGLWVADETGGYSGVIDYWVLQIFAQPVTGYSLRYNTTAPVTEANWNESVECVGMPISVIPGDSQILVITGLQSGVKYYFGLKSLDNVGHESEISNSPESTTLLYARVIFPNGGESWSGGAPHQIRYTFSGNKPPEAPGSAYKVRIYCVSEEGVVRVGSQSHLEPDEYSYSWNTVINNTELINSTNVRILINVTTRANYSYGEDQSDSNFTIDSTPPTVINATSDVSILPDTLLVLEFSESMNRSSVESAFAPSYPGITWSWSADFIVATISHDNFTTGTYSYTINTTAKDASEPGNSILQDYTFSFKVVELLEVCVNDPNGGEVWNGLQDRTIVYTIVGGYPPYNVSLYWVNGSIEELIGYDAERGDKGSYTYSWQAPAITNNTLKIKVEVVDNTTPRQVKSDLSDKVFEIDSTPPGTPRVTPVDNIPFEGYPRAHAVKVSWLAPGDDGNTGTATSYDIRYNTVPITDDNWDRSTQTTGVPTPRVAGTPESLVIHPPEGLTKNQTYYVGIMAYDNIGFSSGLSRCSIKTLDELIWGEKIITSKMAVENTEIQLTGNLLIAGNATLNFTRVLLIVASTVDFEYRIEVAPSAPEPVGGWFDVYRSNITSTGFAYLFRVWSEGRFWLRYSSVNYCGGKAEDIPTDYWESGLEIHSSDVLIQHSLIADGRGLFVYTAIPDIIDTTFRSNYYGVKFGDVTPVEGIPEIPAYVNLIDSKFIGNNLGIYSDSSRVRLTNCILKENFYGAIYNKTPQDFPHNISGVIDHSTFDSNKYAILAKNSSLKAIATVFTNNTKLGNEDLQSSNFHATIYLENCIAEFVDNCKFVNNAYLKLQSINISDPLVSTIYCKNVTTNIVSANFSNNNGIDFNEVGVWNYILPESPVSTFLQGLTTTIYFEVSNVTIINSNLTDNGYPFSAKDSFYITSLEVPGAVERERIPIKDRVSGPPPVFSVFGEAAPVTVLGMPVHYSMLSVSSSVLTIRDSNLHGNLQGILCFNTRFLFEHNNVTFLPWDGHLGQLISGGEAPCYEGTINCFLRLFNSPLTARNNTISEYFIGIMFAGGTANITDNTFVHCYFATLLIGTAELPETIVVKLLRLKEILGGAAEVVIKLRPILSKLMAPVEIIAVEAVITNNNCTENLNSITTIVAKLTLQNNYLMGMSHSGLVYFTFIQTIFLYSTIDLSECTLEEHGGLLGDGIGIQVFAYNSTLHLSHSSVGDTVLGIFAGASKIYFYNTTLTSYIGLEVFSETTQVDAKHSDFYGVYVCFLDGKASLKIYKVNISASTIGIWSGYYDEEEMEISLGGSVYASHSQIIARKGIICDRGSESTVSVDNTVISSNHIGIEAYDSDITVADSTFAKGDVGIQYQLWLPGLKEWSLNLVRNEFSNLSRAIDVSGIPKNLARVAIEDNKISGCTDGIKLCYTIGKIKCNTITDGGTGLYIAICELEINDNRFERMTDKGVYVSHLTVTTTILNNIFCICRTGLEVRASSCKVVGNVIEYSGEGVLVVGGAPQIIGNNIYSSSYGIFIKEWAGTEPTIAYNDLVNNDYGLYIEVLTKGVHAQGNNISFNGYGLYVSYSWGNTVLELSNNKIFNNTECGIYMIALQTSVVPRQQITVLNSNIWNNTVGIKLQACKPLFKNTTVLNNTLYDAVLLINAKPKCINTTLCTLNLTDISSELEVYVNLAISMRWQTGIGVENATVTGYNRYSHIVDLLAVADSDAENLTKIVYYDTAYPLAWVTRSEAEFCKDYLFSNGFTVLNATQLKMFMQNYGAGSVAVMSQDVVPDTVADVNSPNAIIRQYLNRGGMIIWIKATPFYYQGHADGTYTKWGEDGMEEILGVRKGVYDLDDRVNITTEGLNKGLKLVWKSIRPVNVSDVTEVYATAEGGAAAWLKSYNTSYPESGFIRIWDDKSVLITEPDLRSSTDKDGKYSIKILTESVRCLTNLTYHPYTITANIDNIIFSTKEFQIVNKASILEVWNATGCCRDVSYSIDYLEYYNATLYDSTSPTISPEPLLFSNTANTTLKISGTAWDNIGILNCSERWNITDGIRGRVNNGTWHDLTARIASSELAAGRHVNVTVEWFGVIDLKEGENLIEVEVRDESYNATITTFKVTLDTTPPIIIKHKPEKPDLEVDIEILYTGKYYNFTVPPSTVSVNVGVIKLKFLVSGSASENVAIQVNQNNYRYTLDETGYYWVITDNITLTLGYNTITIILSDSLGNQITYVVELFVYDNKKPSSMITSLFKDSFNTVPKVEGIAQDDLSGINKVEIKIYNYTGKTFWDWDTGSWSRTEFWFELNFTSQVFVQWSLDTSNVKWQDGCEYYTYVRAVDSANNSEDMRFKIFTYDTTKPFIHIPIQDGYRTKESYLTISGRTDPDVVSLTVNGAPVEIANYTTATPGRFSFTLELGEGTNTITIIAADLAGNVNELTITVEKYAEKPFVTETLTKLLWIAAGILLAGIITVLIAGYPRKPKRERPPKPLEIVSKKVEEREVKGEPPVPERRYF